MQLKQKLISLTVSLVFTSFNAARAIGEDRQPMASTSENARLIVTTDLGGSDPDDIQSMIHLLVCSDRIDIEGLISTEAWVDDPDKTEKLRQTVEDFIEVLPTLKIHSSGYPSTEYLRSIVAPRLPITIAI